MKTTTVTQLTALLLSAAAAAHAAPENSAPAAEPALAETAPAVEAPKPPPAPYSLPWALRPAAVANVVRSDNSFALFKNPKNDDKGFTYVSMLLGSYAVTPSFAPLVRLGIVRDSAPGADNSPVAFLNPVVGGTYLFKFDQGLRLALFLGLAIPVGAGGGDTPAASTRLALSDGINARSAMDNAMFATNYFTPFPGFDLAWVRDGVTLQLEATVLALIRVKGAAQDKEEGRVNFTAGFHAGYFVLPELVLSAEIRYQRWITEPAFVAADLAKRDVLTVGFGPRGEFKLGDSVTFRPGVSLALPLDEPLTRGDYKIIGLDLPFAFK